MACKKNSSKNAAFWDHVEDTYLSSDRESLKQSFARHMEYSQARTRSTATPLDSFKSAAYSVRDRLMERWNDTQQAYRRASAKRVCYLSMEFLLGRALGNMLVNLGIYEPMTQALEDFGYCLEELRQQEPDAGLGNGGLGRLAACFLDSMATLQLPGFGYGIRYDYGIFEQRLQRGYQVELPDGWLRSSYPWEIVRPEYQYTVSFGGWVEETRTPETGELTIQWHPASSVVALAHDMPVPGYRNETVNTLRLWSARPFQAFDLTEFNRGDYMGAMQDKVQSQTITSVLYPKDDIPPGRELRLKQEYFFVSATVQDVLRRHLQENPDLSNLPDKVVLQLNDTHPALTVAEVMRLLLDVHGMPWDEAWELTRETCAYTNHTVLPEALETWSVPLFERLLPRHLAIIYEINHHFLDQVRDLFPEDPDAVRRMSIIRESPERAVRMAHLALVGSRALNGVSKLHSGLLKERIFPDFYRMWPERFQNKTNGITQRRWLALCNPRLAKLIDGAIGPEWVTELDRLEALLPLAEDAGFREEWRRVKQQNKARLAWLTKQRAGVTVDPDSLFDSQAKRIHEYKRQLLNVLHVLAQYRRLKRGLAEDAPPRTVFFAGKAAPGYHTAKLIIKLVDSVARRVNEDPETRDRLKVAFLPNYGVSMAQVLIPGSELSEQISTAGLEASGTGNMKYALNGALTIGTLDGANIEIRDAVGEENIFIFGLTEQEISKRRAEGYDPRRLLAHLPELQGVLELILGELSPDAPNLFLPLVQSLTQGGDPYFLVADWAAYVKCQRSVEQVYRDPEEWTRRSILNTAAMGVFSSDRTIRQYAEEIWGVAPVKPLLKKERRYLGG